MLSISRAGPTLAATRIVIASTRARKRRQRVRVAPFRVVERRQRLHLDLRRAAATSVPASRSPPEERLRPEQPPREAPGGDPVLPFQVHVARAHRQPVVLPDDRGADDLDAEVEVPGHRAQDRQLLVVLLPEDRHVRLGREEQLRHHRGHPAEMAGAPGAAQPLRDAAPPRRTSGTRPGTCPSRRGGRRRRRPPPRASPGRAPRRAGTSRSPRRGRTASG